jgi:dUTP pyrophosphatase
VALEVVRIEPEAKLPTVSHPGEDLGYDLYALENTTILGGTVARIRTGIAARYESWMSNVRFGLLIRDRSSFAAGGIFVVGGVIDYGYTGEIIVFMRTMSTSLVDIYKGERIAQMIPMIVYTQNPVMEVQFLPISARKAAGFGSTGR